MMQMWTVAFSLFGILNRRGKNIDSLIQKISEPFSGSFYLIYHLYVTHVKILPVTTPLIPCINASEDGVHRWTATFIENHLPSLCMKAEVNLSCYNMVYYINLISLEII